jgi:hypothetical protein
MSEDEVTAVEVVPEEAPVEEAPAPSRSSRKKAQIQPSVAGNCVGELVQLPDVEGTTYHEYTCKVCDQIVHVGLEDLEQNGLPPEHHKREEDK